MSARSLVGWPCCRRGSSRRDRPQQGRRRGRLRLCRLEGLAGRLALALQARGLKRKVGEKLGGTTCPAATCLIRPHVFYVLFVVSRTIILWYMIQARPRRVPTRLPARLRPRAPEPPSPRAPEPPSPPLSNYVSLYAFVLHYIVMLSAYIV